VEAYPDFDCVLRHVKQKNVHRIVLAPFMIVAGDHAINDLAGETEHSWKSRFEAEGYEVDCVLKGLGEYPAIRKILIAHVEDSLRRLVKCES
jgi:sirohydrochlorin cobaltochelatase